MTEALAERSIQTSSAAARERLLAGLPVREQQFDVGGISTATLMGGIGPPMILLHGPGEDAINWRWVIPDLTRTHTVIAPDLPAHGRTSLPDGAIDADGVVAWLDGLIDRTCDAPPIVVGHVLGGAIGARYAIRHSERLRALVLVDSLGLARFRPKLWFMLTMLGFVSHPTPRSYERFMTQCSYDLDELRNRIGDEWEPFVQHNLASARSPQARIAGRMLRRIGMPRIPDDELARITVPTTLIWGRGDRATRQRVAEAVSRRFGWPLHVIENAADDPARDQPEAFTTALRRAIEPGRGNAARHPI